MSKEDLLEEIEILKGYKLMYQNLNEQNKLYRNLLTSRIVKQLIRLEDKGCYLPDEYRESFLKLKYAVEALEGEINDSERINKRTREI